MHRPLALPDSPASRSEGTLARFVWSVNPTCNGTSTEAVYLGDRLAVLDLAFAFGRRLAVVAFTFLLALAFDRALGLAPAVVRGLARLCLFLGRATRARGADVAMVAWAAASLATGTRNGLQET